MYPSCRASFVFTALVLLTADLPAQGFKPNLGPDLPTIAVTCDDITILLRQSTQWTLGRIDYRGTPMTTERSAYGTVFLFPDIGFIGTAHLENEPEQLQSLSFFIDGKEVTEPSAALSGETFRFVRLSKIRDFELKNIIEVKKNRLYETTTIRTDSETPLDLIYHFMHAWTPTASTLLAGNDAQPDSVLTQPLLDNKDVNRKFYIQKPVDWIAIYEPTSQQYAVSRLLQAPAETVNSSMVWNVSGTYRKYYLKTFQNETVPKGFNGTWKMVTAFGESDLEDWAGQAQQLSTTLRP